jgi:antitoxin VapB
MPLSIRNQLAEKLAREIAKVTGENITQVIIHSLEERLTLLNKHRRDSDTFREIMEISNRCSAIPDRDTRAVDEILGYNEIGV